MEEYLARFAGPAGVILVSIASLLFTFRRQLFGVGEELERLGVGISQVRRRGTIGGTVEGTEEVLNSLRTFASRLDDIIPIDSTRTPRQTREALFTAGSQAGLSGQNIQALARIIDQNLQGTRQGRFALRGEDLEQYNQSLQNIVQTFVRNVVVSTEQELEPFRRIADRTAQPTFEEEQAARDRDTELLQQQREEEDRIQRILERQREEKLSIVDAQLDILRFEREAAETGNQREAVEIRLNELVQERDDLLQRANALRFAGLTTEADDLAIAVTAFNLQINRLETGLRDFYYTGFQISPEDQIRQIEEASQEFQSRVGRDGVQLFDTDNLAQGAALWENVVNTLGVFNERDRIFQEGLENASFRLETIGDVTQEWLTSMRNGLQQVIVYTDDWGQALERLGRLALTNLISSLFTEDRLRTLFTGRQFGGHINAGEFYRVGEDGPELFVSNTAGRMVSNRELSQGSIVVNQTNNISSTDGPGVRRALAEFGPQFRRDLEETINNQQAISFARQRFN